MKARYLSDYFTGVAAKRLQANEVNLSCSHQHEFNKVDSLQRLFGESAEEQTFPTRCFYLSDDYDDFMESEGSLTWQVARERHSDRSEHRLCISATEASESFYEGDLLVIGRQPDGRALVVGARDGSTILNQIEWLLGLATLESPGFSIRDELATEADRLGFVSRSILEQIGVVVNASEESFLDPLLKTFGEEFPSPKVFSSYARDSLPEIRPEDDPDDAIMAWMEREKVLYQTLEYHLLAKELASGSPNDADRSMRIFESYFERRESWLEPALKNHLAFLFDSLDLEFSRFPVEDHAHPDFVFPGIAQYRDAGFPRESLTLLGAQTTYEGRWHRVVWSAERIPAKHLLTLDPAIICRQTDEMKAKQLQLVVPRSLHPTFSPDQRKWLFDVATFVELVRGRQG